MINILILDDNPKKIQNISRVLRSIEGIESKNISFASDIISAKKLMMKQNYDVLFLDIQIPNRIDQDAKVDGGLHFLRELKSSWRYSIPLHIIGITEYEDSFKEVSKEFGDQLISIVIYNESSDDWEIRTKNSIIRILKALKASSTNRKLSYDFDVAIICALEKPELSNIKSLSRTWSDIGLQNDDGEYYACTLDSKDRQIKVVAAASTQMGMTAASVLSMKMINNFAPRYLIMSGIAAGIKKNNVNLGDILVADPSWDYGSGKIEEINGTVELLPDPQPIRVDSDIISIFKKLSKDHIFLNEVKNSWPAKKPDSSLSIHIGPVASGSAVLAHHSIVDSILKHNRKAIGVEMETYGVLFAAEHCPKPRPIAFSIKSVCDYADEDKNDNFQDYAAYTSASILHKVITDYLNYDF